MMDEEKKKCRGEPEMRSDWGREMVRQEHDSLLSFVTHLTVNLECSFDSQDVSPLNGN